MEKGKRGCQKKIGTGCGQGKDVRHFLDMWHVPTSALAYTFQHHSVTLPATEARDPDSSLRCCRRFCPLQHSPSTQDAVVGQTDESEMKEHLKLTSIFSFPTQFCLSSHPIYTWEENLRGKIERRRLEAASIEFCPRVTHTDSRSEFSSASSLTPIGPHRASGESERSKISSNLLGRRRRRDGSGSMRKWGLPLCHSLIGSHDFCVQVFLIAVRRIPVSQ